MLRAEPWVSKDSGSFGLCLNSLGQAIEPLLLKSNHLRIWRLSIDSHVLRVAVCRDYSETVYNRCHTFFFSDFKKWGFFSELSSSAPVLLRMPCIFMFSNLMWSGYSHIQVLFLIFIFLTPFFSLYFVYSVL